MVRVKRAKRYRPDAASRPLVAHTGGVFEKLDGATFRAVLGCLRLRDALSLRRVSKSVRALLEKHARFEEDGAAWPTFLSRQRLRMQERAAEALFEHVLEQDHALAQASLYATNLALGLRSYAQQAGFLACEPKWYESALLVLERRVQVLVGVAQEVFGKEHPLSREQVEYAGNVLATASAGRFRFGEHPRIAEFGAGGFGNRFQGDDEEEDDDDDDEEEDDQDDQDQDDQDDQDEENCDDEGQVDADEEFQESEEGDITTNIMYEENGEGSDFIFHYEHAWETADVQLTLVERKRAVRRLSKTTDCLLHAYAVLVLLENSNTRVTLGGLEALREWLHASLTCLLRLQSVISRDWRVCLASDLRTALLVQDSS